MVWETSGKMHMAGFDYNQSQGLFMVGLPEDNLILLTAISEKTGSDIPTVIAKAIIFLAKQVLSEDERRKIMEKMKAR